MSSWSVGEGRKLLVDGIESIVVGSRTENDNLSVTVFKDEKALCGGRGLGLGWCWGQWGASAPHWSRESWNGQRV
jgi:hypothetical protein